MNARIKSQATISQAPSPMGSFLGLLQRECSCGAKPGRSDDCAECRKKQLTQERYLFETAERPEESLLDGEAMRIFHNQNPTDHLSLGVSLGHNFGNVRVRPDTPSVRLSSIGNAESFAICKTAEATVPTQPMHEARPCSVSVMSTSEGCGCSLCARQRAGEHDKHISPSRERPPEDETSYFMVDGVVGTATVACYGGGGGSRCNPGTGNYDIIYNNNKCCTRDCTQQHEQQHVTDLQPCCKALNAKISAGGDRDTLVKQFNTWMSSGAADWSECNSYKVSISCGEALRKTNKCDSTKSTCCDEIDDYLSNARAQKTSFCAKAPKGLPTCPF